MGKLVKAIHDIGTAVWWGGTLMGTVAMNPSVEVLDDPEERGKMIDEGWARFQPYAAGGLLAATVAHIIMRRNPPQKPSATYTTAALLNDACLGAAIVSSVATLALGEYSSHFEGDLYEPSETDDCCDGGHAPAIPIAALAQLAAGIGLFVTGAICASEREKAARPRWR